MRHLAHVRRALGVCVISIAGILLGAANSLVGVCGPFTDAAADSFCAFILEIFTLGITTGTTPTTYDPSGNVTRLQMAAFLSRTVDGVLTRGGRRAALRQHWTTRVTNNLALTALSSPAPTFVESDGADVWVSRNGNPGQGSISRVRASDGKLLETWTGAFAPAGVLPAMGRIFVADQTNSSISRLLRLDPSQPAGAVTAVATNLGAGSISIAYDGTHLWTANGGDGNPDTGSMSILTPSASIPWTVTNVALGFSLPYGVLYDGGSVWVSDLGLNVLFRLSASGAILQTVTVEMQPRVPVFDGANIWVPNTSSNSVSIVRASSGAILRTLTGNGLASPFVAAFDGQRVLVTNVGDSLSLWKAADLSVVGTLSTTGSALGACSDGVNFWIAISTGGGTGVLARF